MIHTSLHFAFFGTPQLSADILETLRRHNLVPSVIVTNPDRPQGRKMTLTPPPVKLWALANNIPCLQPEKLDSVFNQQLITYNPQLFVVVAYGSILPKELLAIPERGSLNIHYSLLPKYRGASPIESQILADDRETGVSILLLDEKMDHGPIVAKQQLEFPISNSPACAEASAGRQFSNKSGHQNIKISKYQNDSLSWPPKASELRDTMNTLAGEMLVEVMPTWVEGKIEAKPQDHSKATYTKKFTKTDGEINLSDDPYKNFLKIQAFESSIGAFFYSPFPKGSTREGEGFKSSDLEDLPTAGRLATSFSKGGIKGQRIRVLIKSAEFRDGKLLITRVVPEGKKEMSYEEFLRGHRQV